MVKTVDLSHRSTAPPLCDSISVFVYNATAWKSPWEGKKGRKMKKENLSLILDLLADSHRALEEKLQEETILKEYWMSECTRMEKVPSEGKVTEDEIV